MRDRKVCAIPADPAEPTQAAFCARHRARARVYRRAPGDLSLARVGWPITTPKETRATAPNWLREPLRLSNHHRSGQFLCYEYRST